MRQRLHCDANHHDPRHDGARVRVRERTDSIACGVYSKDSSYIDMPTDNCGAVTLTWTDTDGSGECVLPVGYYIREYTAVDECNNTSTAEQIIILTDDEAPVFDFVPADYTAGALRS